MCPLLLKRSLEKLEKKLCTNSVKQLYTDIQLQIVIYGKFVDFHNNYLSYVNDNLQLDDSIKLFYTVSARTLNSRKKKKKLFPNSLETTSLIFTYCKEKWQQQSLLNTLSIISWNLLKITSFRGCNFLFNESLFCICSFRWILTIV